MLVTGNADEIPEYGVPTAVTEVEICSDSSEKTDTTDHNQNDEGGNNISLIEASSPPKRSGSSRFSFEIDQKLPTVQISTERIRSSTTASPFNIPPTKKRRQNKSKA